MRSSVKGGWYARETSQFPDSGEKMDSVKNDRTAERFVATPRATRKRPKTDVERIEHEDAKVNKDAVLIEDIKRRLGLSRAATHKEIYKQVSSVTEEAAEVKVLDQRLKQEMTKNLELERTCGVIKGARVNELIRWCEERQNLELALEQQREQNYKLAKKL